MGLNSLNMYNYFHPVYVFYVLCLDYAFEHPTLYHLQDCKKEIHKIQKNNKFVIIKYWLTNQDLLKIYKYYMGKSICF